MGIGQNPIYRIKRMMRMKRKLFLSIIFLLLFVHTQKLFAQDSSSVFKPRIAIFAPLYLDSAFDAANNYRYGAALPKFMNPGLEFYAGVQLALDSLNLEGL